LFPSLFPRREKVSLTREVLKGCSGIINSREQLHSELLKSWQTDYRMLRRYLLRDYTWTSLETTAQLDPTGHARSVKVGCRFGDISLA
jgi:hypothetical protein